MFGDFHTSKHEFQGRAFMGQSSEGILALQNLVVPSLSVLSSADFSNPIPIKEQKRTA